LFIFYTARNVAILVGLTCFVLRTV